MATVIKNTYETIFVVDLTLGEEKIKELIGKFTSLISAAGEIVSVDDWGKRRLAYPINDMNEAYYTLVTFNAPADFPLELERIYKITEGIIRFITIRKDA